MSSKKSQYKSIKKKKKKLFALSCLNKVRKNLINKKIKKER